MTLLSKTAILCANDLQTEDVEVPEWGGAVRVRSFTGRESFRFRHSTLAAKTRIKARESARRGGLAVPALLEVGAVDVIDEESEVDEPF